jgi:hypothetical protein
LEEAAYIDQSIFYDVIVPLMMVDKTAIMAISSPADEFNYYSTLLELKRPDGSFLFKQFRIGMACEECMEAGQAVGCTHKTDIMPHWLSVERSELAKCLYGDNEAAYQREVQGLIASSNVYVFNRRFIQNLQNRNRHRIRDPDQIREIHISIDPHGGGDASEMAIMGITYHDHKKVVSRSRRVD